MALHRQSVRLDEDIKIAYIDHGSNVNGVLLLLHGFPQTSYQFRHVIIPLAEAGYRVLAPDYRGAGQSSKPTSGFNKTTMARDMVNLLDALEISTPVHVVGHDIGGMIAYAMASRFPARVATVNWGECPLPGTSIHDADRTNHAIQQFHFIFHCVPDLPEALVAGRERIYLQHFFSKIAYNMDAIGEADIDHYVREYSQPGAMRCAFGVYRAFLEDAEENRSWIAKMGKCSVPATSLSGSKSRHKSQASTMFDEMHEPGTFEVSEVDGAAHYLAEENPAGFVEAVLRFITKHSRGT